MNDQSDGDIEGRSEEYFVFVLCGEEFAVPLDSIEEVRRTEDRLIFRIAAADALYGLINLRGTVVPVLDARRLLDLDVPLTPAGGLVTVLVFMTKNGRAGLAAEDYRDVITLEPARAENGAGGIRRGMAEANGKKITLLAPEDLFEAGLLYRREA